MRDIPDAPLNLTFLGSGNAFAPAGRYWSSFLVNDRYLFDPSPIALPHLKKLGKAANDIDLIFISHFHADHWFGLPFLLLEYDQSARDRSLTIVGPPGVASRVRAVTDAGFPHVLSEVRYDIRWVEARDGLEGEAAGLTFRAVEVQHAESLTCFGYRAVIEGRTLAYTGDTVMCDALLPLAEGADVFVVECACWDDACGPHLSPADIRELRRQLPPSTRFVLTHLDAGPGPFAGDDGYVIAEDLATITL